MGLGLLLRRVDVVGKLAGDPGRGLARLFGLGLEERGEQLAQALQPFSARDEGRALLAGGRLAGSDQEPIEVAQAVRAQRGRDGRGRDGLEGGLGGGS
ncbi:hypothetical protein D3C87_1966190 [compost metagenome]